MTAVLLRRPSRLCAGRILHIAWANYVTSIAMVVKHRQYHVGDMTRYNYYLFHNICSTNAAEADVAHRLHQDNYEQVVIIVDKRSVNTVADHSADIVVSFAS